MDTNQKIQDLEQRLKVAEDFINSLKSNSSIPLEIDQAFRARFAVSGSSVSVTGTGTPGALIHTVYGGGFPISSDVPPNAGSTVILNINGASYEVLVK